MSAASAPLPTPEGPGSVPGAPQLPAGFADTGRLRRRHPGRRPGGADGGARPPALCPVRDRHQHADRLRPGRRSLRPAGAPGRLRGPPPGHLPLTAAVPPPAAQRPALAPRLQPAPRRGEQAAGQGTGGHLLGHLLRRGLRRLGRDQEAPADAVRYYVDTLAADAEALRGSLEFYRALGTTTAQNQQRKTRRLTMPVLAIGGAESWGEAAGNGMKPAADDVQTVVIVAAGHWVAEQASEEVLAALTEFLAPYRDRG